MSNRFGHQFNTYSPSDWGPEEVELQSLFYLQMNDARQYFLYTIKPRLDRSYKLYIGYTGDRQMLIKKWQANVFVPYTQAVVETLMPRVLDARPEFTVQGRTEEDQMKAEKQQQLGDYLWEVAGMDKTAEDLVRASLVYGTGFLQVSWKKDVRKLKFLKTKDVTSKKYEYEIKEKIFYDAPFCEWIDNYNLWYDWHNTDRKSKQYWFKRYVLTAPEIRRRYPMADKNRLELALNSAGGDLNDYANVRTQVKTAHELITKGANSLYGPLRSQGGNKYNMFGDPDLQMYEVFEWYRPFDDAYSVHVGGSYVPILKGGVMPIPYDFKETPFIEFPYLRLPYEFEGYGLPMILENPQIMLNMIKNQRLDTATLSIHKMWIVNPLANINKDELVTRPFGIIYSTDPNGVREVQFSDIKSSAYQEEDLLKADMRYSSGIDDFSMGVGGGSSSATEVRHLRESTLERVRLFVNHLGDGYADVMRYWMDMSRQFFTKEQIIRIVGDNGEIEYPLIEKDDLCGFFDYKAAVLPSIAGQGDVKKKQDMDLFQLLVPLPFVDQRKLTAKVLQDWSWSLDSIAKSAEEQAAQPQVGPDGQPIPGAMPPAEASGAMPPAQPGMPGAAPGGTLPPELMAAMAGGAQPGGAPMMSPQGGAPGAGIGGPGPMPPAMKVIPPNVLRDALATLRGPADNPQGPSPFTIAGMPINLLQKTGAPPTVAPIPPSRANPALGKSMVGKTTNPRGLNRTGKVNTNISTSGKSNPESSLMNRTFNTQR